MKRILFVCLGNICRSPVAEGVMRQLVAENNLEIEVDSAGTSSFHEGAGPDERSIANAAKHNVDISMQRSRPFEVEDFDRFDEIYVMDRNNYHDVINQSRGEEDYNKVEMLLNLAFPKSDSSVPDPYFGRGDEGFENVFQLIKRSCQVRVNK